MFYSYKNFPIYINGVYINSDNISISLENGIEPYFTEGDRVSNTFYPVSPLAGNLNFDYFLTGQDVIKQFINKESDPISIRIGDTTIQSGFLQNYNLNFSPNGPIKTSAKFLFFEELGNLPTQTITKLSNPTTFLNASDIILSNLSSYNTENIDTIESINYSYSVEITPNYTEIATNGIRNLNPSSLTFGKKSLSSTILCDSSSGALSISGNKFGVNVYAYHPANGTYELFNISGISSNKSFDISSSDIAKTSITVNQYTTETAPLITSLSPVDGVDLNGYRKIIRIYGSNFNNLISAQINNQNLQILRYNDSAIETKIPITAYSGYITVKTFGGIAKSSNKYSLTYPAIRVNSIDKLIADRRSPIFITGQNFYNISHVLFNNVTGQFSVINDKIIQVTVPLYANSGYIKVLSSGKFISGVSNDYFMPNPIITGIDTYTGMWNGNPIKISGIGFNSVTGVYVNNITGVFTKNSDILITLNIPSGNTKGPIVLSGIHPYISQNIGCVSNFSFLPQVPITGVHPQTGIIFGLGGETTHISISGMFFDPTLIKMLGSVNSENQPEVLVGIGGSKNTFAMVSPILLTGALSNNATDGYVYLFEPDGVSTYSSSYYFDVKYFDPVVAGLTNTIGYSGYIFNTAVIGQNLYDISGLRLIGKDEGNNGIIDTIHSQNCHQDLYGTKLIIQNHFLDIPDPATASIFITGLYGLHFVMTDGQLIDSKKIVKILGGTGNYNVEDSIDVPLIIDGIKGQGNNIDNNWEINAG